MTGWTPELETAIRQYADVYEKQLKYIIDPKTTVIGTTLRLAFNGVVSMLPAYRKVCKIAGWNKSLSDKMVTENTDKMIDLATQNGSDAANKILKAESFNRMKLAQVYQYRSLAGYYQGTRLIKKSNFQY